MNDLYIFILARDLIDNGHPYQIIRYGDGDRELRKWEAEVIQLIVMLLAPWITLEIVPFDRRRSRSAD